MDPQLNIKCVNTTTDSDGSQYGKFVIEPLQRGYGITLGNSLRRVLLSSMPGSALTAARIEGVNHEFTTIPGVKEDVLNILLNIKGVVLKNSSEETQYLRIDADSVGPVLAGDIQTPGDVKVINADHLICTVSEGGGFHCDLTVENGYGYVQADIHENVAVDMMLLDAIFMPIRRVAYHVEDTRVGQQTDYDKLVIEIWSNGSLDVTEALSKAANYLIEHLLPIASLTGAPMLMAQHHHEDSEPKKKSPNITVEDLELSVRAFNCLKRANIHNIEELLEKSEHDLLNIKNFGKKSADEVIERLHAFGLDLKPNPEDSELIVE